MMWYKVYVNIAHDIKYQVIEPENIQCQKAEVKYLHFFVVYIKWRYSLFQNEKLITSLFNDNKNGIIS